MDQNRISQRLTEFMNIPTNEFRQQIQNMLQEYKSTLEFHFEKLRDFDMHITYWLLKAPRPTLDAMNESAKTYVFSLYAPEYHPFLPTKIRVSVTNAPVSDIRMIGDENVGHFSGIVGVVTRISQVFQHLLEVNCKCNNCESVLGPFLQKLSTKEVAGRSCSHCQSQGPFTVTSEKTIYSRYKKLTLQSRHHLVSPTTVPICIEVILLDELAYCGRLGQELEITGIYTKNYDLPLAAENEFCAYAKVFEANYVASKQERLLPYLLNNTAKEQVLRMSKDPQIKKKIISCFARGIPGHEYIKTVIALAMFGGQGKTLSHRDINVLLLGDPDSPMSLFMECVEDYAPKAVRASPTALKATVHHNPVTQESTLEGGALVLADKGICLINNIDQIDDENSQTFHDALSLHISESESTPNYRCSIIAGATPIGGRYDSSKTFWENVVLKDHVVSAFDVLCVVKDDMKETMKNVSAIVELNTDPDSDAESTTSVQKKYPDITHDMLKNYITYARLNVFPTCTIPTDYDTRARGDVPVPEKQLHSLERLAEAHARMHLRHHVTSEDVLAALHVLSVSLISSQKLGAQESVRRSLKSLNDYLLFANALQ